jgi:hypothetical protein
MYLFFSCPFSDACWTYLGIHWDLSLEFQAMVLNAILHFNSVIFRKIFIIGAWSLWCHRNDIIFYGAFLSFLTWKASFLREMDLVLLRAKPRLNDKLKLWLSSLL